MSPIKEHDSGYTAFWCPRCKQHYPYGSQRILIHDARGEMYIPFYKQLCGVCGSADGQGVCDGRSCNCAVYGGICRYHNCTVPDTTKEGK